MDGPDVDGPAVYSVDCTRMIRRRIHTFLPPPMYRRVRACSQRPYSACSASSARTCPIELPRGTVMIWYS